VPFRVHLKGISFGHIPCRLREDIACASGCEESYFYEMNHFLRTTEINSVMG
jgi:hypothetical protein